MEPNLNTHEVEMPFISPYMVIDISPLRLLRLHMNRP